MEAEREGLLGSSTLRRDSPMRETKPTTETLLSAGWLASGPPSLGRIGASSSLLVEVRPWVRSLPAGASGRASGIKET